MAAAVSYDLHVHPGPSVAPRWGDGRQVWEAAVAAGVRGFVWKAHERHTADLCRALPTVPVRAIASASLNAWASPGDVSEAIDGGALWVWGPTLADDGAVGWELPLPGWWDELAAGLSGSRKRLVVATGHLGTEGRKTVAELARAHDQLTCSVTHTLYVPKHELPALAQLGCVFEIDAYTLVTEIEGRQRMQLAAALDLLTSAGALVYFTSDGGQASTGDPFLFGARVLDRIAAALGRDAAESLGVRNPAALVDWVDGALA
jgi:hypothetical protein